jgi:hypothetical protein
LPPFAVVAAVVAALAFVAPATAAPGSALSGSWLLDEGTGQVAHDGSGQRDDGVLTPGVRWVDVAGRTGVAFGSDSSARIEIAQSPSLEPAAALTLVAWVRSQATPSPYSYIAAMGADKCTAASYGLYTGDDGGASFYVATGDGPPFRLSASVPASLIWDGGWHQLVGTYDAQKIRLYLDGEPVGQPTPYTLPIQYALNNSTELLLGNYATAGSATCRAQSFPGALSEVSVWSQALPASYVHALYVVESTQPATGGAGSLSVAGGQSGTSGLGPLATLPAPGELVPAGEVAPAQQQQLPSLSHMQVVVLRSVVGDPSDSGGTRSRPLRVIVSYVDSAAALTSIKILRVTSRSARACAAVARSKRVQCARLAIVGTSVHGDRKGTNSFLLGGVHGRQLAPGRYQLQLVPGGRRAGARTVSFVVPSLG